MIKFLEDEPDELNPEEELAEKDKPKKKKKLLQPQGPNEAQMVHFFKKQENELPKLFSPQKKVEVNNFIDEKQKFDLDEKVDEKVGEEVNKENEEKKEGNEGEKLKELVNEGKEENKEKKEGEVVTGTDYFVNYAINRNIYLSPFIERETFNPRWRKLVLLFNSMCLMFFLNAVFYTMYDQIIIVIIKLNFI